MSFLCSQAQEGVSMQVCCSDGKRLDMSSMTTTVNELSPPASVTASSTKRQSSETFVTSSSPVRLTNTGDLSTWLAAASPVSPLALPGSASGVTMSVTSGRKRSKLSGVYSQPTLFSKTAPNSAIPNPDIVMGTLAELFKTWPKAGMTQGGVFYPQPKWERRIVENASGLWPTPKANGNRNSRMAIMDYKNNGTHKSSLSLEQAIEVAAGILPRELNSIDELPPKYRQMFPTPTVDDANNATRATGQFQSLTRAVMYPTPSASDPQLERRAGDLYTTATGTVRARLPDGRTSNRGLPGMVGGVLNPEWVEWLMGWPIGSTALEHLAMDRFRSWQQQHGIYSRKD